MKTTKFPIRLKIMLALLFSVTAVVGLITFTTAKFFHEDKQAYVNDWVSIAAVTTADECNALLVSYARRLNSYARVLRNREMPHEERAALLGGFFNDLPELIDIRLYETGRDPEEATDQKSLQTAGLDASDLQSWREANPLPLDAIRNGEIYLKNTTISSELPAFTLAVAGEADEGEEPVVIAAVMRLDELLRMGAKFKVFAVLLADSDGTLLAHPELGRVTRREKAELGVDAVTIHDEYKAGMTSEFTREGTEMIGGFAPVDFGTVTVAAQAPKAAAYLASRAVLKRLIWVSLGLLVIVGIAGRIWAKRITHPVETLSRATRVLAKGDFDIAVDVSSRDEIGALAGSFNQMAHELKTRQEELAQAQALLVQSEKMAAFGQLGAGIAHEVKNPLAGIFGCAQLALMEAKEGTRLRKNVEIIKKETDRCRGIIDNLLKFARQEKALLEPTDINAVVSDAAAIVDHQLEMHEVKLSLDLAEDVPPVRGNANQLQQVLMNLVINAQQAMEDQDGGSVKISTHMVGPDDVEIIVSDTGPGIPEENRAKLFEPFFTTKPTGKGTGLGLSVSFGIIQDHGGEITVDSEVGQGTEFKMRLPLSKDVGITVGV
ncbi:MAG: HAMP domain-containing protein [bacterium]|nr:HAMP domain-containing protein [bacterium]